MKRWESLIDQKIREAIEKGEFDDLPGKGTPVDLSENPFEDPELRMAHRMLRSAGFAPSWIEERKDVEAELVAARTHLARGWMILQRARGNEFEKSVEARWEETLSGFRSQVAQLNRRIAAWNLKVPAAGFQRIMIDAEREIARIREGE
jgi:DnaJ family protein C protein 28